MSRAEAQPPVMESGFFNPYAPIWIHERKLPHWQQTDALYFLTWRLADSVPASRMREWTVERKAWFAAHPLPLSSEGEVEYRKLFPARIEAWLDQGMGSCVLRGKECRRTLMEILLDGDGGAEIDSFVIMPNHVHALVRIEGSRRHLV